MRALIPGLCIWLLACASGDTGEDAAPPTSATPEAAAAPEAAHVDIDGVTLAYRDYGGTGDLLLFVPSLFMTADVYDRVAPHFTDRYRVLAVTHRWHGTSEQTGLDFTLDTLALDLAGFIEHFTDEPAVVVGWSGAGLILPRLARLRPELVRALVFANAVREPRSGPTDLRVPGRIVPDSVYPSLEAAADHLRTTDEVTREEMVAFLSSAFYRVGRDMLSQGTPPDTVEAARRWLRDYDDVSKSRAVAALVAAIPDARIVVLDEVTHNVPMEDPEVLVEVMNGFLGELERRRR